jgi:Predicted integral membrane protein
MSPFKRFILATGAAVVLGGIIHLGTVLTIPYLADRDAYSLLEKTTGEDSSGFVFSPPGETGLPWLQYNDPSMTMAICPYDLQEGPYVISVKGDETFQSVSFHQHKGSVYFAVTDQAEVRGEINFIVATAEQLAQLMSEDNFDELAARKIRVTAPSAKGLVVLRSLAPFPSFNEIAANNVALAECRRLSVEDQTPATEADIPAYDLLPPRRGGGR